MNWVEVSNEIRNLEAVVVQREPVGELHFQVQSDKGDTGRTGQRDGKAYLRLWLPSPAAAEVRREFTRAVKGLYLKSAVWFSTSVHHKSRF